MEFRRCALHAFCLSDPTDKASFVQSLQAEDLIKDLDKKLNAVDPVRPGRPARPELIDATRVPNRSPFTPQGHAALLHSIAHIEFNAINLALDAIWRFDDMPDQFYADWLGIARDEARHFSLLHEHLQTLGYTYGDFAAHDGLWAMCEKTSFDVIARMALVPRTLEARGLDATPLIQAKLYKVGTPDALQSAKILDTILTDEVRHVAIGNYWYRWLCNRAGLNPVTHYAVVSHLYDAPKLRPPFNQTARRMAGFTDEEMTLLLK